MTVGIYMFWRRRRRNICLPHGYVRRRKEFGGRFGRRASPMLSVSYLDAVPNDPGRWVRILAATHVSSMFMLPSPSSECSTTAHRLLSNLVESGGQFNRRTPCPMNETVSNSGFSNRGCLPFVDLKRYAVSSNGFWAVWMLLPSVARRCGQCCPWFKMDMLLLFSSGYLALVVLLTSWRSSHWLRECTRTSRLVTWRPYWMVTDSSRPACKGEGWVLDGMMQIIAWANFFTL